MRIRTPAGSRRPSLSLCMVPGLPEIRKGQDLAKVIVESSRRARIEFQDSDILVVAQKIISKAEGRLVKLSTIKPSAQAVELSAKLRKDARFVEVVLRESRRILRSERVLIVETHHGFVCANAGVDYSNVPERDCVTLLPTKPDESARQLAAGLKKLTGKRVAVIVSDTFGRPWRLGLVNFAIGLAGFPALLDLRGTRDRHGRRLEATILAIADELAAAAGLLMQKAAGTPVVVVHGCSYPARKRSQLSGKTAAAIIRPAEEDLFR